MSNIPVFKQNGKIKMKGTTSKIKTTKTIPVKNTVVFKVSDYDLDLDERKAKFKDYDLYLCEKCNQEFNNLYCKDCYEKETDSTEKNRMLYGKECFQVKTNNN